MALYNQSDMLYDDYSWTVIPGDAPRITGAPDSTMFSRNEGYEVKYLINALMEEWGLSSKASGNKMERLIHDELPSDIRSQENVKAWISKKMVIDSWKRNKVEIKNN